jgi:hypothetical protein
MNTIPGVDRTPNVVPVMRREYPQSQTPDERTRDEQGKRSPGKRSVVPADGPPAPAAPDGARGRTFADSRLAIPRETP